MTRLTLIILFVSLTLANAATIVVTNSAQLKSALAGSGGVAAGDTVLLRGGTYAINNATEFWTVNLSGATNALITWKSYPGERAAIDGQWRFGTSSLHRFEDLEFYDSMKGFRPTDPALHWDDPNTGTGYNEWVNNYIHDIGNGWSGFTARGHIRGNIILYPGRTSHDHVFYPTIAGSEISENIIGWPTPDVWNLGGAYISNNIVFGGGKTMVEGGGGRDLYLTLSSVVVSNSFYSTYQNYWKNIGTEGNAYLLGNIFASSSPMVFYGSPAITSLWNSVVHLHTTESQPMVNFTVGAGVGSAFNSNAYYPVYVGERWEVNGATKTWAQWQADGYDANSTLAPVGKPSVNMVRVYRNRDRDGRAHVAVYNWEGLHSVSVPVNGILTNGQTVRVINVQNYAGGAFSTGVVSGLSVSVPMTNLAVQPYSYWPAGSLFSTGIQPTADTNFAAFVIEATWVEPQPDPAPPAPYGVRVSRQ